MPMRAVVIGGVAWNTMLDVEAFPEPRPQTVFASGMRETVGSSGAGKALNLAALGAEVTLWSLLGDDDPGRRVRAVIESAGIDHWTATDPAGTMRHVNLMEPGGERISIFGNPGSDELDVDTSVIDEALGAAEVVSVTIMNHCRQFLPAVAASPAETWVDIHDYDGVNPHHAEFIEAADCLLMSSVAMPTWRSFLEERVAAGARLAVCTHGPGGASGLSADSGWVEVAALTVDRVVDTNGAGDAFFAGVVTALADDSDLGTAMEAGAAQAARAVASPGLAPGV